MKNVDKKVYECCRRVKLPRICEAFERCLKGGAK